MITIGYPSVVPVDSEDCTRFDLAELTAINAVDIDWLRGVLAHLNGIIESVADERGDPFVDLAASSEGHDACQPAGTKWVEGVCGEAEDFWPTGIPLPNLPPLPCPEGTHATLIHPNAAGHANATEQVVTAIRAALRET